MVSADGTMCVVILCDNVCSDTVCDNGYLLTPPNAGIDQCSSPACSSPVH